MVIISEYVPLRQCLSGEETACGAGDADLIPGSGKSPEVENGNQIHYSGLENSMDGGSWRAAVHGGTKNQTQPSEQLNGLMSHINRSLLGFFVF